MCIRDRFQIHYYEHSKFNECIQRFCLELTLSEQISSDWAACSITYNLEDLLAEQNILITKLPIYLILIIGKQTPETFIKGLEFQEILNLEALCYSENAYKQQQKFSSAENKEFADSQFENFESFEHGNYDKYNFVSSSDQDGSHFKATSKLNFEIQSMDYFELEKSFNKEQTYFYLLIAFINKIQVAPHVFIYASWIRKNQFEWYKIIDENIRIIHNNDQEFMNLKNEIISTFIYKQLINFL
eukprot:TRINITY_DN23013_c0_g1_i1.p1 TRINITY_DN23013_c0_g1~~TRINITY_DN23013_c0_g1_i1.p1  ORF type:complete len:243 (+),score=35.99 TRINITY_DN23013_c0_g1_i1:114-842(+)